MLKEWLDFSDRKAVWTICGILLFFVLAIGVLPHWLRANEAADLGGVPEQTAQGSVIVVQISPVSQGGGGLFNAVTVAFAGHRGYYALPPESRWNPAWGDPVRVTYRVGRRSGLVHVDRVLPAR